MVALQGFLEELFAGVEEGPLKRARSKAWDQFNQLGLPTKKEEAYRYVPLRRVYTDGYVATSQSRVSKETVLGYVLPDCQSSYLTFVNGSYCDELSDRSAIPDGVTICSLSDASRTYLSFLQSRLTTVMKQERDPFAAVNAALYGQGLFIYVPPNCVVKTPVQILHIVDADQDLFCLPRTQVFVGKQAELGIISTSHWPSGTGCLTNQVIDASIQEGAHLKVTQLAFKTADRVRLFDALRAELKRDSQLTTHLFTDGQSVSRHDYQVALAGSGCTASLNGLSFLPSTNESHVHVLMDHQEPHCVSHQCFKGILKDVSRASFEGKILVQQKAQKTEAYQIDQKLILSDNALSNSKPNLEIFADDVKASHGATVGRLDDKQLFYMLSRGLKKEAAEKLLIAGFCREMVEKVELPSVEALVLKQLERFL